MTLFKHTEPTMKTLFEHYTSDEKPEKKGQYLTDLGYCTFDNKNGFTQFGVTVFPDEWYSEHPPKEIEDAIGFIDIALKVDNETPVILPIEIAKTLLKLRAE